MAFWLKDEKRCAFGRGWEAHRRGEKIDSNPFPILSFYWTLFRDGWNQYVPSTTALYDDPTITDPLVKDLDPNSFDGAT
jgi:hypothetical protein